MDAIELIEILIQIKTATLSAHPLNGIVYFLWNQRHYYNKTLCNRVIYIETSIIQRSAVSVFAKGWLT